MGNQLFHSLIGNVQDEVLASWLAGGLGNECPVGGPSPVHDRASVFANEKPLSNGGMQGR